MQGKSEAEVCIIFLPLAVRVRVTTAHIPFVTLPACSAALTVHTFLTLITYHHPSTETITQLTTVRYFARFYKSTLVTFIMFLLIFLYHYSIYVVRHIIWFVVKFYQNLQSNQLKTKPPWNIQYKVLFCCPGNIIGTHKDN